MSIEQRKAEVEEARRRLLEGVAAVASSFCNPSRLKILFLLAQAPRSVETLASLTGESMANTSQHLRRMLAEGVVRARKDKLHRIYRLSRGEVAVVLENLFDLAGLLSREVATAQEQVTDTVATQSVDLDRLRIALANGRAALIDVREPYEVSQSPVAGALAVPFDHLEATAKDLPTGKVYYLICRGRLCEQATRGVTLMRAMGYEAYRLNEMPAAVEHGHKLKLDQ